MEANPRKLLDEFIPEAMGKQFVIPVYQRKYTWTIKNQLIQLMKDLRLLIEDKSLQKQHFLGTIVYFENIVNYKTERSVVDGQQRLVTMFLIVHALKTVAENEIRKRELDETYLQNYGEPEGTRYRQRLFPSVSDGDEYLLIAEGKLEQLDKSSQSNIVQNFLFLQKELAQLVSEFDFDKVLYAIKRFSIVYIKLDERDNAQQIFESINSTGERLKASDLIRNFIMMDKSNKDQTNLYTNYWNVLEQIFPDSKDMEDFFRYYLASLSGEYSPKKLIYQAFKEYWKTAKEQLSEEELLEKLVRFAKYFDFLYLSMPEGPYKEIIEDFQSIESMMSAPLVLGISEMYFNDKTISKEQYYKSLEVINNYQIRRYFNNDDTSRVSKSFPVFLKNIKNYAEEYGYEHIVDIIIFVLVTKNRNNQMSLPTDRALKINFQNGNAYAMRLTRWLLEKIENKNNTAKLDMSSLSIEHIMPQTSNEYWEQKAGVSGEDYTELVNTMGNLTLVAKVDNSKAGNKNFEAKKEIFENTLHIQMNKNLYSLTEWNAESIMDRSNSIGDKLIEMYPYLRSKANFDHNSNREIFIEGRGVTASGYLNVDGSVTVYAGSEINMDAEKMSSDILKSNRQKLLDEGIIQENETAKYFVENYTFKTPSGAADFILGGSNNGWTKWEDINGTKINDSLRHYNVDDNN